MRNTGGIVFAIVSCHIIRLIKCTSISSFFFENFDPQSLSSYIGLHVYRSQAVGYRPWDLLDLRLDSE